MSHTIARRLDRLESPNGDLSMSAEAERLALTGQTPATLWFEAMDAAQSQ